MKRGLEALRELGADPLDSIRRFVHNIDKELERVFSSLNTSGGEATNNVF